MPAAPKNATGSSLVSRPWCDMVSIRTVAPDLMRSAGTTRADKYPQTTVSGRKPNVTSGLIAAGADCPAADDTRAAMPTAVHQITAKPRTCLNIGSIHSSKISHSIAKSGRGRCRAAGRVAFRVGASLSVAAGAFSVTTPAGGSPDIIATPDRSRDLLHQQSGRLSPLRMRPVLVPTRRSASLRLDAAQQAAGGSV